jgi:hypothetical protein
MTNSISANQKPNRWKLVKLVVKPRDTERVARMAGQPDKKLLVVRQRIHSARFDHGHTQLVFHTYRVRSASP